MQCRNGSQSSYLFLHRLLPYVSNVMWSCGIEPRKSRASGDLNIVGTQLSSASSLWRKERMVPAARVRHQVASLFTQVSPQQRARPASVQQIQRPDPYQQRNRQVQARQAMRNGANRQKGTRPKSSQ
jgi:hypothetical protein